MINRDNPYRSDEPSLRGTQALALVFAVFLLPLHIGCGQAQDSTVSGRVTIDGKPLDHGTVTFVNAKGPARTPAIGRIQSSGAYQVQIGQSGEMVSGEYTVGVSVRAPSVPSPEGGPPKPGELLTPKKYASPDTSGLRYHVREGKNVIDIALAGEVETVEVDAKETNSEAEDASSMEAIAQEYNGDDLEEAAKDTLKPETEGSNEPE